MRKPKWKRDQEMITASGHDLQAAVAFFDRHGMQLSRHPRHGWQFTAVLDTGRTNDAAFWHRPIGTVESLIETLDAPSLVLAEIAAKQKQAKGLTA